MHGSDILARFLSMFPSYMTTIKNWEYLGNRRILVGLKDGSEVEFWEVCHGGENRYYLTGGAA